MVAVSAYTKSIISETGGGRGGEGGGRKFQEKNEPINQLKTKSNNSKLDEHAEKETQDNSF